MQQIGLKTKRTRLFTTSFLILSIGFSCFIYKLYSDRVRAEAGIENLYNTTSSNSSLNQSLSNSLDGSISKNFIYPNSKHKTISSSSANKNNVSSQEKFTPELNIKMPVIMYHHIRSWEGADSDTERGLRVSPSVFERHLKYLKENGYNTINTYNLAKYVSGEKKLPPKPVLLTFDDGYDDNYINAFSLLKKYGMTGDFAIITTAVGRPLYLTWEQIKEMDRGGMSISSHTLNHCILAKKTANPTTMKRDSFQDLLEGDTYTPCSGLNSGERLTVGQVKNELTESKKIIEQKIGHSINTIIYPYGGYNAQVVDIAKTIGYTFGFTVSPQENESVDLNEPFDIPRYRGFGQDDNADLKGFFAGNR